MERVGGKLCYEAVADPINVCEHDTWLWGSRYITITAVTVLQSPTGYCCGKPSDLPNDSKAEAAKLRNHQA
jgi:hypothetical protein